MNCAGGKALFTTADSTNGGLTEGLDETTMAVGEDGTKNEKEEGERQMLGEGEMSRGKGKGNGKGFNKRIQGNHVSTPNPTPTPTPNTLSTQINLPPSPNRPTLVFDDQNNFSSPSFGFACTPISSNWIFDCGAIDTMTFDP